MEFLQTPILCCLVAFTIAIVVGYLGYGWWPVPLPLIALGAFYWMQQADRNDEGRPRKPRRHSDW